jgi:hypothetical protein
VLALARIFSLILVRLGSIGLTEILPILHLLTGALALLDHEISPSYS